MNFNKLKIINMTLVLASMLSINTVSAKQCTTEVLKTFNNPTVKGLRIDKCVQGDRWGLFDPKRCDRVRQKQVSDAYCKFKGYEKSIINIIKQGNRYKTFISKHLGNHSILSYKKGNRPNFRQWTQITGSDAFRKISCSKKVVKSCPVKTTQFNSPTVNGLALDKCVQGGGGDSLIQNVVILVVNALQPTHFVKTNIIRK